MSALEATLWITDGQRFQDCYVENPPPLNLCMAVMKPWRIWCSEEESAESMMERSYIEILFTLTDYPRRGGQRCHYLLDPMSVPQGWCVDFAGQQVFAKRAVA